MNAAEYPRLIGICLEADKGRGEDCGFCTSHGSRALLGAFDGCGGLGARKYADGRTGAAIASQAASETALMWLRETGDAAGLKIRLDSALRALMDEMEPAGRTNVGSMIKPFPTTACIATAEELPGCGIDCEFMWAGDSRGYVLRPDGLRQLTRDDLRTDEDAFDNLYVDSPLSNMVNGTGDYIIHSRRVIAAGPAVVFAATDGTFGYLPSPMHYEWMLLDAMQKADSFEGWRGRISEMTESVTADDSTYMMAIFGWRDFADMREAFAGRHAALEARLIAARDEGDLREYWNEYRAGYYPAGDVI